MKVTSNRIYTLEESVVRIQEILDSTANFEEVDNVPNSDTLTYTNGYYFKCYSIFIDIRNSSKLPSLYPKKVLARIYRAYISEVVAYMQSLPNCKEVNIVGDSVWGIFNAKEVSDALEVFRVAYSANAIIKIINYKLCQKGINPIKIGIGIDKGDALMVLAGFKGSGINDVIYMGGVVNNASKMCSIASKGGISSLVISKPVYNDLYGYKNVNGKAYQSMFSIHSTESAYHGDIVNMHFEEWLDKQKQLKPCSR